MTQRKTDSVYEEGQFTIEGLVEGYLVGYWDPSDLWNGFACPLLPKESADVLMAGFNGNDITEGATIEYYPDTDSYIHRRPDEPEEPDVWKGEDIVVAGETIHAYPIASHAWTWWAKGWDE